MADPTSAPAPSDLTSDGDAAVSGAADGIAGPPSERATVRRLGERGRYDAATVHAILDAGFVCHVGISTDHGPVVIPTAYGRRDDVLYLHGSPAARWLRGAKRGEPVCVTVTLVDGLVVARSTFHHSLNYRSVVLFGEATEVRDPEEKARALDAFVDHVLPGRSGEVRPSTAKEVAGTLVLALPIDEASAKVRTGGPVDEPDDLALDAWAGVVPLGTAVGAPEPSADLRAGIEVPPSVAGWTR